MPSVVIVGGGLSGLYAALLLKQRGIDYLLLEARDRPGGRIDSIPADHAHRFDLGATWYWPAMQPQLAALIDELGLNAFEQHEDGDMLIERSAHRPSSRVSGFRTTPPSVRLAGGMFSLIEAIHQQLPSARLRMRSSVRSMAVSAQAVTLNAVNTEEQQEFFEAEKVLLAVPPRLAVSTIQFEPELPVSLKDEWQSSGTWMAPHAKYVAVYRTPFWRQQGFSGEAQSTVGPMAEVHDASTESGQGALFGFLGIPAELRKQLTEGELKTHCREQLVRLFGPKATAPEIEFLKDWARDPATATHADQQAGLHQTSSPPPSSQTGVWQKRLIGIASEWSPQFPGYMAGAIDAASRGVDALLANAEPTFEN